MNVELHKAICDELNRTYIKKNTDYDDAFAIARKEVPSYTYGKLFEKLLRYKHLSLNEEKNMVESESIEDTLLDLANYCILELVERGYEPSKMIPVIKAGPREVVKNGVKGIICDECGEFSSTLFKPRDGKNVCWKCWHKSEDDLK